MTGAGLFINIQETRRQFECKIRSKLECLPALWSVLCCTGAGCIKSEWKLYRYVYYYCSLDHFQRSHAHVSAHIFMLVPSPHRGTPICVMPDHNSLVTLHSLCWHFPSSPSCYPYRNDPGAIVKFDQDFDTSYLLHPTGNWSNRVLCNLLILWNAISLTVKQVPPVPCIWMEFPCRECNNLKRSRKLKS